MNAYWTIQIDEAWIAWLTFDCPGAKVNTFSALALEELGSRIDELAANEAIKAVAIRSGKDDSFIVGADINELARIGDAADARAKAEAGHDVFGRLAALPVPTVAIIHGTCLGGGLEMALACDYRLVTDHEKTSLGLPEVNLGILPGWGGTQRLPRLVGLPQALTMILTGKPVKGRKARRIGLADGIVARPFVQERTRTFIDRILTTRGRRAVARRRLKAQPVLMRLLASTALGRRFMCRQAHRSVMRRTNGVYPAPLEAIRVIRRTAGGPPSPAGFAIEAAAFSRLACTSISRNLVWLFQASQRLKKSKTGRATAPVTSAGVVGAGIMGGGIAWALSNADIPVRMKDIAWPAVAAGMKAASGMFHALVKRRRMTQSAMDLAMHRIGGCVDYSGFASVDVVIEAVVEDLVIKRKVLADIEAHTGPDTVIATNTSSLPLGDLASALANPKRFAGLHFFNPVNRMQLVEVVAGRKTSRNTVATLVDLVRRMGKMPVVVGDCPGFLVNRILLPYLIESAWMFEEGVGATRIDKALEAFGMPMGPLALVDEVGIDVGYKVAKVLESAYGERMHVGEILGRVVESGELLGRKSGRGFYLYENGNRKPNPAVSDFVTNESGGRDRRLSDKEIVDRAILIMVNEAARCLEEGVVDDPETLDMAMVMGTGFAPFRGGLLKYADACGVDRIKTRLEELTVQFGERFRPVPMIERIAGNGNRFYHGSDN